MYRDFSRSLSGVTGFYGGSWGLVIQCLIIAGSEGFGVCFKAQLITSWV